MEVLTIKTSGLKIRKTEEGWEIRFPERGKGREIVINQKLLPSTVFNIYYSIARKKNFRHGSIRVSPAKEGVIKVRFGTEKGFNLYLKENSRIEKAFRLFLLTQPLLMRLKLYDILRENGNLTFFPPGDIMVKTSELWKYLKYFGEYVNREIKMKIQNDESVLINYRGIKQVIVPELKEFLMP